MIKIVLRRKFCFRCTGDVRLRRLSVDEGPCPYQGPGLKREAPSRVLPLCMSGLGSASSRLSPLLLLVWSFALTIVSSAETADRLEIETRYGSNTSAKVAESRLRVDRGRFDGGLTVVGEPDGSYRISGGVALPWLKAGSLELSGPVAELRSPPEASPLASCWDSAPGVRLVRDWRGGTRGGVACGMPGRGWLSLSSAGEDAQPEAAGVLEFPLRWSLSSAVALLYGYSEPHEPDEWTLPDGVPPAGEYLMTGVRTAAELPGGGASVFAAASLHPWLPTGFYLRGRLAAEGPTSLRRRPLRLGYPRLPDPCRPVFPVSLFRRARAFPLPERLPRADNRDSGQAELPSR